MILTRKFIILTFTTFIILFFLLFLCYVHYVMIKRKIIIWLLRSLRHDLSLFFWFRDCVHYAMIKRKTFYFSFWHYVQYAMITEKKHFYFVTTLTTLQLWKKWVFLFYWDVHYGNIFLHDLTSTYCTQYVTNLSKKFPNNILPVKNMCNLKNFLQWSLTWFTSQILTLMSSDKFHMYLFWKQKIAMRRKGWRQIIKEFRSYSMKRKALSAKVIVHNMSYNIMGIVFHRHCGTLKVDPHSRQ